MSTGEPLGSRPYTATAKLFHWTIALLVLLMLYGGYAMHDLSRAEKIEATMGHTGIGLIILVLIFGRLWWRHRHPPPPLPEDLPSWQRLAAVANHRLFYVLLILQPIIGLGIAITSPYDVVTFGVIELSALAPTNEGVHEVLEEVHGTIWLLLIVLIVVHVAAALHHHFVRRDVVLRRMLPIRNA